MCMSTHLTRIDLMGKNILEKIDALITGAILVFKFMNDTGFNQK